MSSVTVTCYSYHAKECLVSLSFLVVSCLDWQRGERNVKFDKQSEIFIRVLWFDALPATGWGYIQF